MHGARSSAGLVVACAALAVFPAHAHAAVSITAQQIVVTGDGAAATITRKPMHMSFADGAGRTVLAEVPNENPAPFPVAADVTSPPLGQDTPRRPALYAPLAFTVGERAVIQNPAGQWVGNVVTGSAAGVTYSARDVVDAVEQGDGVKLTVSTNDPSGRQLIVTIAPGPRSTIRVTVRPSSASGVASMADSFASPAGEAYRGFGGRHNAIDQRGEDFLNFVQQQNVGAGQLAPAVEGADPAKGDRYLFPSGRTAAYYVQSQFVSNMGYGFLLSRDELSRWRMASDRPDAWQTEAAAPGLDYLVAPGDAPKAIADLTAIAGRHRAPPEWAAGTILDRLTRYPSESASSYQALVEGDLRDIAKYRLPLDAYRIEGWEFYSRDDLKKVIVKLKAMGIRPMLYFRAFVGTDANVGTDSPARFQEAIDKGYVATTATGQPYVFVSNFNVPTALIDFTNPDAVAWWKERIREALDLGADGFMQDFGEQVRIDMHFADGSDGLQMHNRYPVLFHRATRAAADEWHGDNPDRPEPFFYTRAGYSGEPGSAAYESANFAGDGTTDWSRSSGLGAQTPDMLNRAVGGLYGFTTDIGGYFDIGPYSPTTKELFIRWAQWAALSPLFRLHGSVGAGTHTPWSYDDETVALYNALSRLHLRARPLILKLWRDAERTGMPPVRPLWLAEPGDPKAAEQDQQWLLGNDVLVAPVVTEGAASRSVYFPRGCWDAPESGARFTGPGSARVQAGLDQLPYFFRCGTSPFDAADGSAARLPRRCTSRRRFTIRLRDPRGPERVVAARVFLNGRAVRVLRGRRLRARIDLRGLPHRRVRIRVVSRTDRGRTLRESRTYRTCTRRPRA